MLFVYIALTILVGITSRYKFGRFLNIVSIFTATWALIAGLSTLGFYNLRLPSRDIHIMSIIFIITSDLVMMLTMRGKKWQNRHLWTREMAAQPGLRRSGVHIVQIAALVLISVLLYRALIILLRTGSISAVRSAFYGEDYSGQYVFNFVFRQVPTGLMEGLIIYYTYVALVYHQPKQLLYAVINVIIVTITSGGRYEIILFALVLIMTFLIGGERLQENARSWFKKYRKLLISLGLLLIAIGAYITLRARSGGIMKGLISYSAGSLSFLDYIMENPRVFGLEERLYGYMTFGAILEPFVLLFKFLGLSTIKTPSWYFNYHCQPFYNIVTGGARLYFNNNTSILYFLYYDFGFWGTIIGGLWMGGLMSYFHNRMMRNDLFSSLLYIYFGAILLLTPMYYKFFNCNAVFTLLALYVCSARLKVVIRKREAGISL